MTARHVLAIDQGTTNTKALLIDQAGAVVARAEQPVATTFPKPGWVEQDAVAVWRTVADAIDACLGANGATNLAAIGISNQRESVLLWDRATGTPLGPVVVWQCRRTAAFCEALRRDGHQALLEARTGLTIDPLFSGSKIRWLLDTLVPGLRAKILFCAKRLTPLQPENTI